MHQTAEKSWHPASSCPPSAWLSSRHDPPDDFTTQLMMTGHCGQRPAASALGPRGAGYLAQPCKLPSCGQIVIAYVDSAADHAALGVGGGYLTISTT